VKQTTILCLAEVRTKASRALRKFSSIAQGSSIALDQPVQIPVLTKLIPAFSIISKSFSQIKGLGSKRNFLWTSEPIYVVQTIGNTFPSFHNQSRDTEILGEFSSKSLSFIQKPE